MRMPVAMVGATALSLGVLVLLTGCLPAPAAAPTPTATGYATEEEAFAAARDTYSAYFDAMRRVDLADPSTFEPLFALSTGEANAADRKFYSQAHADGIRISGEPVVRLIEPSAWSSNSPNEIDAAVCLDVSQVLLTDAAGKSVVDPSRPDIQSVLVSFSARSGTRGPMLIANVAGRTGEPDCEG